MDPNEVDLLVKIGEQASEILMLKEQIERQGREVQESARAAMQVISEDAESLILYKEQNTLLVNFIEKIADSKSKFAPEARIVLGF